MQDETSIESQQEECQRPAERDGQPISPSLQFTDEAISGTKLERDGLNAMLEAAQAGRFNRLYFFSLSRLARESVIGMPILKRLVNVYKIRVISVTEGLDTSRENWELQAQILLMQHERYIKELSANVFRGQAANIRNGYSNGDYCYGYTSEPVPGTEQKRRGRRPAPRMVYAIHPVTSVVVKQIFFWFVQERRAISWIVRRLNELNAPRGNRAKGPKKWRHCVLLALLANRKFVGDWAWGRFKNARDPESGDLYQESRPEEEAEKFRRTLPHLRLIDDETFRAAQQLLAENRQRYAAWRNEDGEYLRGNRGVAPPARHLLSQLIQCGECGRFFIVGGVDANYLKCPNHAAGLCSVRTQLKRRLAERLLLGEVGRRLRSDEAWLKETFVQTHAAWLRLRATRPDERRSLEASLAEVERRIQKLVDAVEDGEPDPEIVRRLSERREARRQLREQMSLLDANAAAEPTEPTEAWIREKLQSLHETLADGTPAAAYAFSALVGGRIVVREVAVEGMKRRYLRGTLQLPTVLAAARLCGQSADIGGQTEATETVEIVFREADPRDAESDKAWKLSEDGAYHLEIAKIMGISKLKVTRLLRRAACRRGVAYVDGRARRSALPPRLPSLYVLKSDEAGRLDQEGVPRLEIAQRLGIDLTTMRKSIVHFYTSRGLPVSDGRVRRKSLGKQKPPDDIDAA